MAILTVTAANVRVVRMFENLPDGPVNEVVAAGVPVRIETTGHYTPGNGSSAGEAAVRGIACNSGTLAGATVTVMKRGLLDVGVALDAMAYGAPVYLSNTDGTLDTAAGTVSTIVGYVVPAWGATTADKLLLVNL
jgi:hypothetical protein